MSQRKQHQIWRWRLTGWRNLDKYSLKEILASLKLDRCQKDEKQSFKLNSGLQSRVKDWFWLPRLVSPEGNISRLQRSIPVAGGLNGRQKSYETRDVALFIHLARTISSGHLQSRTPLGRDCSVYVPLNESKSSSFPWGCSGAPPFSKLVPFSANVISVNRKKSHDAKSGEWGGRLRIIGYLFDHWLPFLP